MNNADASLPVRSFDDVYRGLSDVGGWLSRNQAGRLWDRASELRAGQQIAELGSFHGRSAIVLATAAPAGVSITTVDPHAGNDRGPQEIEGFDREAAQDNEIFHRNLASAGVQDRIRHLRMFSQDALGEVERDLDLLYIDAAHRFGPALGDIRQWGARVRLGGTMLVHDSFSSVGVTLALLASTVPGAKFRYTGRTGSMAEFRRVDLNGLQRLGNGSRQLLELGWFARNLVIKALIVARMGRATRLLGGDGNWPY